MLSEAKGPSYSVPSLVRAQNACGVDAELWSGEPTVAQNSRWDFHRQFKTNARFPILKETAYSRELAVALRHDDADVFHTHGLWLMPNVEPSRVRPRKNSIFVLTVRGMLSPEALAFSKTKKDVFWHVLQKHAVSKARFLHATAKSELSEIRDFGLDNPVVVLPNGIDIPELSKMPVETTKTVLSLGRLHPKKNLEYFIELWAALEDDFKDWRLRIIGPDEGNYRSKLEARAKQLRTQRVSIEDPLFGEDKAHAFQSADLFVLPSLNENFALTVSEALAGGTPVLSSTGAPWSGLSTNDCGWWRPLESDGFAMGLQTAMSTSRERLGQMGQNGRDWMRRDFGWNSIGERMIRAYQWGLGGGDKPAFVYDEMA